MNPSDFFPMQSLPGDLFSLFAGAALSLFAVFLLGQFIKFRSTKP